MTALNDTITSIARAPLDLRGGDRRRPEFAQIRREIQLLRIAEWRCEEAGDMIAARNLRSVIDRLVALLAERDALRAEMDDAREELQHVLREWNELKKVIGSLTNGGVNGREEGDA